MPIDSISPASAASTAQAQTPPPSQVYPAAEQKQIVDYAVEKFTAQKTQAQQDLALPDAQRVAAQTQRLQTERGTQVQQQVATDQFYDFAAAQYPQSAAQTAEMKQAGHALFDKAIAGIDQQIAAVPANSAQNAQQSLNQANNMLAALQTGGIDALDLDTASKFRQEAAKAASAKLLEQFKGYGAPGASGGALPSPALPTSPSSDFSGYIGGAAGASGSVNQFRTTPASPSPAFATAYRDQFVATPPLSYRSLLGY